MAKKQNISVDIEGARSRLGLRYFTAAAGFASTGTSWSLGRESIIFGAAGASDPVNGDDGASAGIDGNLNRSLTDFLKGGYPTEKACFTVTEIGLDVVSDVFEPDSVDGDLTNNSFVVSPVGTVVDDCISRKNALIRAALAASDIEVQREGETCELILGNPEQYPAGLGFSESDKANNGMVLSSNRRMLKRPIVLDPKTQNGSAMQFILNFRSPCKVAQDPNFPAVPAATPATPEVARCRAMLLRMTFCGYVSDEDGNPVGDDIEQAVAAYAEKAA